MNQRRLCPSMQTLALSLAFWLLFFPALVHAQTNINAIIEAENQAKTDVSRFLWMGAGCLFSLLGVLVGYLVPLQHAPANALMGKSPEYVDAYSAAYDSKVKSIQGGNALIGCSVNGILFLIYTVLLSTPGLNIPG